MSVPGSTALVRYVKPSHQDDPFCTLLELILVVWAIWTWLMNRVHSNQSGRKFVKEIDELADEWTPKPLCTPLNPEELANLDSVPVSSGPTGPKPKLASNDKTVHNFALYNFTGLAGNNFSKERTVKTLYNLKYGLSSCSLPGFYSTSGECIFSYCSPTFPPELARFGSPGCPSVTDTLRCLGSQSH